MNNSKANGLQNAHFSIISVPGLSCAIEIRETAIATMQIGRGVLSSYECLSGLIYVGRELQIAGLVERRRVDSQ